MIKHVDIVLTDFNIMENSLTFIDQIFQHESHETIVCNITKNQRKMFWEEKSLSQFTDDLKIFKDLELNFNVL